jgi:hypothetical protein
MPRERPEPDDDADDARLGGFLDELPEVAVIEDDDDDFDDDDEGAVGEGLEEEAQVLPALPPPPPPRARVEATPPPPPPRVRARVVDDEPARRPPARTPRPRGMSEAEAQQSPGFSALKRSQDSAYQELDTLLGDLNFASRQYKVRVERETPQRTLDGIDCSGFLDEYIDKVSTADIKASYGGGVFTIRIFGPHPMSGKPGIIKVEKIKIAGPAKMPVDHENVVRAKEEADRLKNEEKEVVVSQALAAQERSFNRLFEVVESKSGGSSELVEKLLPAIIPVVKEILAKGESQTQVLLEQQKIEREERRREDDRRREEEKRALEERRREDERREDRRREEEKARREEEREERRREEDRRREEREEKRAEEDRRREEERIRREEEREARRREDEERRRAYDQQLLQAQERQKYEREQSMAMIKMTQEASASQQQMLMNSFQFQLDIVNKRQEAGGFESVAKQLVALSELKNTLTGEGGEQSTVDKITEFGERFFVPLAQQAMASRRAAAPAPAPQARVAVVDLGPKQATPAAQTTQPQLPAPNPGTPEVPDQPANDLTALTLPTGGEDMMAAGLLLLKNIDFAVQKEWSVDDVVERILEPFAEKCPMLMNMAGGLTEEQLMQFLQANVPPGWAIMSMRGEDLVKEAFASWQDDEEEGVA